MKSEEEDDVADWGLDEGDQDEEMDYTEQIIDTVNRDRLDEAKKLGVADLSATGNMTSVLNYKSIRLFSQTNFYQEA